VRADFRKVLIHLVRDRDASLALPTHSTQGSELVFAKPASDAVCQRAEERCVFVRQLGHTSFESVRAVAFDPSRVVS
jgi:hypothetical protein